MGEEKRKNGCGEEKKWVLRREIVLWGHCMLGLDLDLRLDIHFMT